MRRWLAVSAMACALLIAGPHYAMAQLVSSRVESSVSRPSRGPSNFIGGYATRAQTATISTDRSVSTLGERGFSMVPRSTAAQARRLPSATLGLQAPITRRQRNASLLMGLAPPREMFTMAYHEYASGPLPAIDSHLFTPRPDTTSFQDFFGLVPEAAPRQGATIGTLSERLEARTQSEVRIAREAAVSLFEQATIETRVLDAETNIALHPNCTDCADKLIRAAQHLRKVYDLDPNDYVTPVLLAHALLEQERPLAAAGYLLSAWRRNPDLLDDAARIDQYFGDVAGDGAESAFLEWQMRRFAGIGKLNAGAAEAHALAAYCYWRLGDEIRARKEAQEAIEIATSREASMPVLLNFMEALAATVK